MSANLENSAVAIGLEKSVFIPIPKNGNVKECSNYCTIKLISHASKAMLKIFQARLQQYVQCELPMFKLDLEKAEEPEIKLPTSIGSLKKQESSRKTSAAAAAAGVGCHGLLPNTAQVDAFLELCCFFSDPADVGNLVSGSSSFSKTSLNIWTFTVHVLLFTFK